jgi:RNA recognition motif-containing protein
MEAYFGAFGAISECMVVKEKDSGKNYSHPLGRNRGFGFVIFEATSSVEAVIWTQTHILDDKEIECKIAIPKQKKTKKKKTKKKPSMVSETSPMLSECYEDNHKARKIFVGGLPKSLSDEELYDYFSQFGEIQECITMKDRISGFARGFGFVTFKTIESVNWIMMMRNSHQIRNKWIDCKQASPKSDSLVTKKPDSSAINVPIHTGLPKVPSHDSLPEVPLNPLDVIKHEKPTTTSIGDTSSSLSSSSPSYDAKPYSSYFD